MATLLEKIKSLPDFKQWQLYNLPHPLLKSSNIELLHLPCNTINVKQVNTLFKRGLNCRICNNKNTKLTTPEFIEKYNHLWQQWQLSPEFQYYNNKAPFDITHIKCNTTISTCKSFIDRNKLFCPVCELNRKSYNKQYSLQRLIFKYPNYDFDNAVYIDANTPLKVRCRNCNTESLKPPTSLSQCKQCYDSKISTQHKNNILSLAQQYPNFEFQHQHNKDYQGVCKRCGQPRVAKIHNMIKSFSCKTCDVNHGNSKLETQFANYIKSLTTHEIIYNTRDLIPPYEIDIYIPSLHLAIEFNGNFWHSHKVLSNRGQDGINYHLHKTLLAFQQNVYLVHIFEDEWLHNTQEIQDYLKQLFKLELAHNETQPFDLCKYPFLLENRLFRLTPPVATKKKYYNCGYAILNEFPSMCYTPPYVKLATKDATIDNYKVSYYYKDYNVAVDVITLQEHIHFAKDYLYKKSQYLKSKNIRLICVYHHYATEQKLRKIINNVIIHALNKTPLNYYARDLTLQIRPARELKQFFEDNNIHGYKPSTTTFCLINPTTQEIIMAYAVGHAYFGINKYEAEITRGACKLGCAVIGGASKLWNAIIKYYETHSLNNSHGAVNSIVYYVDLNLYNGQSMQFLKNVKLANETYGFWNYFVETQQIKNRSPFSHKHIKKLIDTRFVYNLYNVGTQTNIWQRYPNET